jgi:hypothetical protein
MIVPLKIQLKKGCGLIFIFPLYSLVYSLAFSYSG